MARTDLDNGLKILQKSRLPRCDIVMWGTGWPDKHCKCAPHNISPVVALYKPTVSQEMLDLKFDSQGKRYLPRLSLGCWWYIVTNIGMENPP